MSDRNSLFKQYKKLPIQVKASAWFLACSFLQKGISTITTPVFTRLLSTTEYGQYNVFNSWLGIITIFVTLQLYSGVYTQGLIKYEKERKIYSSSLQGLTTVLVLVWTVIYLAFYNFWNRLFSLTTVQMLAMLLMVWTTAAFNFWAAEQRVGLKYKRLVIITLIVSAAKPAAGIFFVIKATDAVTARILGLALVELICYTGLYISQMIQGKKFFSGKFWKYALLFNLPLVPHYLSQSVLNSADRIMISNMVGNAEAGIYSLAYSVSLIMTLFNSALSQTLSPWIYKKIKDGKIQDIHDVSYCSLEMIAAVNIILIAVAPEVIAIFAPSSYYAAIWIIPPVSMSVFFTFSYDLFAKFEFYFEKTKFIMFASIIGAIANVILNKIFIGFFGYIAAGYTTLLCYIIYAFAHYCCMNRVCDQKLNGEKPYKPKFLILLSGTFVLLGFYFLFTYNFIILRYLSLLVLIIVIIAQREKTKGFLNDILAGRNIR